MSKTETREQQIQRLIDRHVRDRNMDPRSIEESYKFTHLGIEIDPDFFEARLDMGWGFFKDEPRHLDHITRNMIIFVYLAYRRSTGCYHQGKKAVMMGATYEQMVEALEAAHVAGGGLTLHHGFEALQRMRDEGLVPGSQEGPWRNHWVEFDIKPDAVADPRVELPMSQEDLEANIRAYYSAELGAGKIAEDLVYASRIDPDFWSRYLRLAWGVYQEKECFPRPDSARAHDSRHRRIPGPNRARGVPHPASPASRGSGRGASRSVRGDVRRRREQDSVRRGPSPAEGAERRCQRRVIDLARPALGDAVPYGVMGTARFFTRWLELQRWRMPAALR